MFNSSLEIVNDASQQYFFYKETTFHFEPLVVQYKQNYFKLYEQTDLFVFQLEMFLCLGQLFNEILI